MVNASFRAQVGLPDPWNNAMHQKPVQISLCDKDFRLRQNREMGTAGKLKRFQLHQFLMTETTYVNEISGSGPDRLRAAHCTCGCGGYGRDQQGRSLDHRRGVSRRLAYVQGGGPERL